MKVAIIGSRNLSVDIGLYIPENTEVIISGGAKGIDSLAEEYADTHNIKKMIFRPNYNKFGRNAPLIRDRVIVNNADLVIAIWDGKSGGTKYTIDYAKKLGKKIKVFFI